MLREKDSEWSPKAVDLALSKQGRKFTLREKWFLSVHNAQIWWVLEGLGLDA